VELPNAQAADNLKESASGSLDFAAANDKMFPS
jgi:hypothetical protein